MKFSQDEKRVLLIIGVVFIGLVYQAINSDNAIWITAGSLFALFVIIVLLIGNFRRLRNQLDGLERNNQSIAALYNVLRPERPLPELGGYALSAAKAAKLMELVLEKKPRLIVELGSGVSTIVSAYCLKMIGAGKIVSFDHDEQFASITRDNISKHGLAEYVEIIHAPIADVDIDGSVYKWYDIDISKFEKYIDMLFVDGPPRKTQNKARYPALRFFKSKLGAGALVLLDDANRADEIEIRKLWLSENSDLVADKSYFRDDLFIARKNQP